MKLPPKDAQLQGVNPINQHNSRLKIEMLKEASKGKGATLNHLVNIHKTEISLHESKWKVECLQDYLSVNHKRYTNENVPRLKWIS
jgi:hypothetical protein